MSLAPGIASITHGLVVSFFFNHPATTEIYTLSLHDALPIYLLQHLDRVGEVRGAVEHDVGLGRAELLHDGRRVRSEEHTSELQSHSDLVCRLLLEKKNK